MTANQNLKATFDRYSLALKSGDRELIAAALEDHRQAMAQWARTIRRRRPCGSSRANAS